MMRRFRRRVQSSGKLIQAKKVRFRASKSSKNKQHASALHRIAIRRERDYLERTGKLPVDERPVRKEW